MPANQITLAGFAVFAVVVLPAPAHSVAICDDPQLLPAMRKALCTKEGLVNDALFKARVFYAVKEKCGSDLKCWDRAHPELGDRLGYGSRALGSCERKANDRSEYMGPKPVRRFYEDIDTPEWIGDGRWILRYRGWGYITFYSGSEPGGWPIDDANTIRRKLTFVCIYDPETSRVLDVTETISNERYEIKPLLPRGKTP
jgi:hypothetical protein